MKNKRLLGISALALSVGLLAYDSAPAQTPAQQKKQELRKKLMEDKKKAEAEAAKKKAEEDAKIEASKASDLVKQKALLKQPVKFTTSTPVIKDARELAKRIDAEIDARLAKEKIPASPLCTDSEFVRRAYLDITGVIPPMEKAKAFLDSKETDKRAKLVDELLASSNYGKHMADIWMSLLVQRTSDSRRISFEPLRDWLTTEFNKNKPWSETVYEIVTATGTQEKAPAGTFYISNNTVDKMTDQVTKLFLGVSMQCAQCHDHRFEDWKQKEYWSLTQFFMKVSVVGLGGAKSGDDPGVNETDRINRKRSPLPEAAMTVPASFLRDGGSVKLDTKNPSRPVLGKWITSTDNPYFAKAMVNRTWAQFFGTGIVNPLDDMGPNEAASHPKLLNDLSDHFARGGFDVKNLIRAICNSQAYQRSTKVIKGNDGEEYFFARMAVKVLTPEQLYDSTLSITQFAAEGPKQKGAPAMKGAPAGGREKFVNFFLAGAEMANTMEYEAGIPQALKLMNSRVSGNPAAVKSLLANKPTPEVALEKLYLSTLSRRPTTEEVTKLKAFLAQAPSEADGYADIMWALLNSSEYTLCR